MLNIKLIIGIIIHFLISILMSFDAEYLGIGYFLFPFVVGNLIGIILITLQKEIIGAKIFIISSVVFVPIGLIGIFGAKEIIEKINKEKFLEQLND